MKNFLNTAAGVLMAISGLGDGTPLGKMLLRQAGRIAINRTVAGVHFPMDSRAGQILGTCLAEYVHSRATGKAWLRHRSFDANSCLGDDFLGYPADETDSVHGKGLTIIDKAKPVPKSLLLASLWAEANKEWK